jgi:hypothetical protein
VGCCGGECGVAVVFVAVASSCLLQMLCAHGWRFARPVGWVRLYVRPGTVELDTGSRPTPPLAQWQRVILRVVQGRTQLLLKQWEVGRWWDAKKEYNQIYTNCWQY